VRWAALRAAGIALAATAIVAGDVAAYGRKAARFDEPLRNLQASEALLVRSLLSIRDERPGDALRDIDALLAANPDFELAHLIKGDLLMARAGAIRTLGDAAVAPAPRIEALREEARARLARYSLQPSANLVPKYLLQMHPQQRYAVVVDTVKSTLYLFQNDAGRARYVADYYISVGKNGIDKLREGDKKTPLGVYRVVGQVPARELSDFYGAGAWPIDYPNEWDRRHGRKGHGIWLHGTPRGTYSRPPRASDGCVVLANDDLTALGKKLQAGLTPVIIAEAVEWVDSAQAQALREELGDTVERWRRDRERGDADGWLAHYARSFPTGGMRRERWAGYQRRALETAAGPVALSEVTMFLSPGRDDLAVVTFRQERTANGKASTMRTRQYWVREFGLWKIAYEGAG
jgi:murein L,D-transpeptidase YafK